MNSRRRMSPPGPFSLLHRARTTRRVTPSVNPARQRCAARHLLHVAPHGHLGGPAGIDVAGVVHADAFRRAELDRRFRNEGGDLAVLDAANADALLEARI